MGEDEGHAPTERVPLEKLDDYSWRIPKYRSGMRVTGLVLADKDLLSKMQTDRTLEQCSNVTHLPGIYKYAITLPDGHEGYGFPIGGVAATDYDEGVISPGGVGYDINCGVRLLTTNFSEQDVRPKLVQLANTIFENVPCGLGSRRKDLRVTLGDLERIATEGVSWAIAQGLGWRDDAEHCEELGCMKNANPNKVSATAKSRGLQQVGTLGSGNHFLEIQKVDKILDTKTAKTFGIDHEGQVTVMIHCGSRGFGHQICSDYLQVMERAVGKYKIELPDRELACAPGKSKEAEDYYQAMACAVNYAFANRQAIMHWVRQSFKQVFKEDPERFGLKLVYDVAHNIAKIETHEVDGEQKKVWVHRKGATRAFPPGNPEIPRDYSSAGQPVLIPGSMGTSSWLLVGTEKAMQISFGSTAHGAGRMMSRTAAKRNYWGADIKRALEQRGIYVRAASSVVLAEEADPAYKNVDVVAEVSDRIGIATKVARFVPLAVVKG
ncbi:RNA-splicing ligase RtcB [Candidatus Bathyarchaeota archaeon RBG_13_46_16b]|nr:MAG: RNA-splicing ligase RtcB [Candidatus Bathyarchaeota archaeon RBG_13_46_16b]